MKYGQAIEGAKLYAKFIGYNVTVCRYRKHWWNRYKYNYGRSGAFYLKRAYTKLLTITPNGTIAQ